MASLQPNERPTTPNTKWRRKLTGFFIHVWKKLTVFATVVGKFRGLNFGRVASAVMDKQLLTRLIKKHDEELLWTMANVEGNGAVHIDGHQQRDDATCSNNRQQRNTIRTQLAHHKCHIELLQIQLLHNRRARITAETRTGQGERKEELWGATRKGKKNKETCNIDGIIQQYCI